MFVPTYRKHELSQRTSVFVCFALRTQAKPDEAEPIQISSPNESENTRTTANYCRNTSISLHIRLRTNFRLVLR